MSKTYNFGPPNPTVLTIGIKLDSEVLDDLKLKELKQALETCLSQRYKTLNLLSVQQISLETADGFKRTLEARYLVSDH